MEPLAGVRFVQGDFREQEVLDALLLALGGRKADLVISDLAPNISGIGMSDQARSMYLCGLALEFARQCLKPGGSLLVKVFQLSLIHISEPTRLGMISYAVFCL